MVRGLDRAGSGVVVSGGDGLFTGVTDQTEPITSTPPAEGSSVDRGLDAEANELDSGLRETVCADTGPGDVLPADAGRAPGGARRSSGVDAGRDVAAERREDRGPVEDGGECRARTAAVHELVWQEVLRVITELARVELGRSNIFPGSPLGQSKLDITYSCSSPLRLVSPAGASCVLAPDGLTASIRNSIAASC